MASELGKGRLDQSGADAIDLRSIGLIFRRRSKLLLGIALGVFVLGVLLSLLLPNRYDATANVLIDRRTTEVADVTSVLSGLPSDSASVDTEVRVLQSPALLRRVVDRLQLDKNPDFNPALAGKSASWFGGGDEPLTGEALKSNIVDNVADDLSVARQGLTYVIGVTFTAADPVTAARVANAVAAEYLATQVRDKREAAKAAQNYLGSRLSGLRSEVQGKEQAAQSLRARSGMPGRDNAVTFDEGAITDLNRQSIQLQSDLADRRARLEAAQRARGNAGALPAVIESNVIRDLKAQRAAALARNADITQRYGPLHPETEKARGELQQIDSEINAEIGRITSSLRDDVSIAQGRLSVISGALARQRGEAVGNARNAVAVSQFDREAQASRDIYEDFLKRTKETATTGDLAKPDAAIVNVATPPAKAGHPNRPLLAVLAALLGLGIGAVAVIVAELLDAKVSSAHDVERWLDLPSITSVPSVPAKASGGQPWTMIVSKPLSSYAEAFRGLTSYMRTGAGVTEAKVLMVTSALPHEGKTTVAAALATSLASTGQRVLLIDTDLRRPYLAKALGLASPAKGIGEVLAGTARPEEAIQRMTDSNLDVMLVGSAPQDAEMFRSDVIGGLIERLRAQFDHIVIDTPPVLAISDPRYIARSVDAVLFAVRWRRTSRFAARSAVDLLRSVDAPLAGVILNGVDLKKQALYSKDDALSFYGAYRTYYAE